MAVTTTLKVQVLLARIVPPVRVTLPAAATGVKVPPQVFENVAGVATTILLGAPPPVLGKVSVKVTAVMSVGLPLVSVKFSVLFWPN